MKREVTLPFSIAKLAEMMCQDREISIELGNSKIFTGRILTLKPKWFTIKTTKEQEEHHYWHINYQDVKTITIEE